MCTKLIDSTVLLLNSSVFHLPIANLASELKCRFQLFFNRTQALIIIGTAELIGAGCEIAPTRECVRLQREL